MIMEVLSNETCCTCSRPELPDRADPHDHTELRPYGPNGALICFDCAMKPENREEVERRFETALNAAETASVADGATIGHIELTKRGPRPLKTGRS